MPSVDVLNQKKEKVGSIQLNDSVFAVKVNIPLVHQVLKAELAGVRQGTAKTKTKSEVRGGGRKPFRQKGTGNARQGSSRSPLHPGGGQSFGPQPRSYEQATPKEMIRGALRSVLSDRLNSARLLVLDEIKLSQLKTKEAAKVLKDGLGLNRVLIVDEQNTDLVRVFRNIRNSKYVRFEGLNVCDVLKYDWLVLTKKAAKAVEGRLLAE